MPQAPKEGLAAASVEMVGQLSQAPKAAVGFNLARLRLTASEETNTAIVPHKAVLALVCSFRFVFASPSFMITGKNQT